MKTKIEVQTEIYIEVNQAAKFLAWKLRKEIKETKFKLLNNGEVKITIILKQQTKHLN